MFVQHRSRGRRNLLFGTICALSFAVQPALAIEWDSIVGKDITLFYPGQASWEWVLTQSSHSGAKKFRQGKNCRACHEGEEAEIGNLIVSGRKLEPEPIDSKRGFIPLNVKAANDGERLYIRLEWFEQELNGFPVMDLEYEVKVTVMFDDGSVVEAPRAGCWGACHDDSQDMASDPAGQDIKKYLARSRTRITRRGGGLNYKPEADIAALADSGIYLEYWQARLNHDASPVAVKGYILEGRKDAPSGDVSAQVEYSHGKWVVVLSRALAAPGPYSKTFEPGRTYSVGFAIHDAHAARRFHHISLEYTLVLNLGDADIVAVRD